MKVLMINVVCGIRSTGRICTDIASVLEANGHEVKIAYGREKVPEKYEKYAVKIGSDIDVKAHVIKARFTDGCGFGSKAATRRFIGWVKEYDPDVIHLHNLHGYYINVEILFDYLRSCGKRIIWTLHDCWAFTGHSALCDAVPCEKWKTGCGDCPHLRAYPKSFIDRSKHNWTLKKSLFTGIPNTTIVTPSEWLMKLTKESFLGDYDVEVVNNGINLKEFHPMDSNVFDKKDFSGKKVVLGVASTWSDEKGLNEFFRLAQLLDEEYKIVLIGMTNKQIEALPKGIIGMCRTNNVEELAEIYSSAHVLVNLSKTENYPTIIMEAAACGTPCISYDVGGSRELASAVVERGDVEAVAKAINDGAVKNVKTRTTISSSDTVIKYEKLYL